MIKELSEIREELLIGVENNDILYIKMQINKIDTLLYNAIKNNNVSLVIVANCSTCKYNAVSKYVEPCYGCRDNDGYDHYKKND